MCNKNIKGYKVVCVGVEILNIIIFVLKLSGLQKGLYIIYAMNISTTK